VPKSLSTLTVGLTAFDAVGRKVDFPTLYITDEVAPQPYQQTLPVPPSTTVTFFDGTRSISANSTTVFTLTLSPLVLDPVYRLTWTAGTAPMLRTPRYVDLTDLLVTITVNANETATFASDDGIFSAVQVGDTIFIPGVSTGDPAGPFSEANCGFWNVLARSTDGSTMQLARRAGQPFSALGELVTVIAVGDLVAFSSGPVQIGDSVYISAGFSQPILRTWRVRELTATWFEIVASDPLPSTEVQTAGTPPVFYSSAKRALVLTVDQEADAVINGVSRRLSPPSPGSVPAVLALTGPVYSLSVTSRAAVAANAAAWGV